MGRMKDVLYELVCETEEGAGRLAVVIKLILFGFLALFIFKGVLFSIPEGHVGIVKQFSRAHHQVSPGLNFRIPIVHTVEVMDVRERHNVEVLEAATQNQLAITATTSINWAVKKDRAMELYINYGGLDQFERRILDPKLRSAAKGALAQFPADRLIQNRQEAVAAIMRVMTEVMEGFPVDVRSPQLEEIGLPQSYRDKILEKERAREAVEQQREILEQQELKAQERVKIAQAEADSKRLAADARAYQLTTEAEAEANAIRMVSEQLASNQHYVSLAWVKRWDGVVPKTLLGGDANTMFSVWQNAKDG